MIHPVAVMVRIGTGDHRSMVATKSKRIAMSRTALFRCLIFGLSLFLWGCSSARLMMPTPNVLLTAPDDPYQNLSSPQKSTDVQLLYFTDRAHEYNSAGALAYGYERSGSIAFGTAVVELGVDITWEELLNASLTHERVKPVKLALGEVAELVRTPNTPLPYTYIDGKITEEPTMVALLEEARVLATKVLQQRLAETSRKDLFIYIHGYHNSFADAAFDMAELWHFIGRSGVPIIYSWPAGFPGLFGYAYDRESSEFTIWHLRETLLFLSEIPEVEKIHIIAHSRGTDVATAALREITLKTRAAGIDPRIKYKIHNFVLAAPDLDVMVAEQRIDGDNLPLSVNRFTIYTSPDDRAISFAQRIFRSPQGRIGTFRFKELTEFQKNMMEFYGGSNFAVIQFQGASSELRELSRSLDSHGHSYFRNEPTVSSDLVLMLRDDLDPGAPGRPLEYLGSNFWRIPKGYPADSSKQ